MLHLELRDARALLLARLKLRQPLMPFGRDLAEIVQFRVTPRRNESTVVHHHRRVFGNGAVDEVDDLGLRL